MDPNYVARDGTFGKPDDPFAAAVCPDCSQVVAPGSYYCAICFAADEPGMAVKQRLGEQRATLTQAGAAALAFFGHGLSGVLLWVTGHEALAPIAALVALVVGAPQLAASAMARGMPQIVLFASAVGLAISVPALVIYGIVEPLSVIGPRFSALILHVMLVVLLVRLVRVGIPLRKIHPRRSA